jgi:hypothetical protein
MAVVRVVVQLGDGTFTDRNTPPLVDVLTGVAVVAACDYYACVVTLLGGVRCWGNGQV